MAARKELAFLAYLVAKPRQRLMLKKAFSTKCLNLYKAQSQSRWLRRFFLGGMTMYTPLFSLHSIA
jgi:hypothetical protein